MFKLINIRKAYKTFDFTQTALDGVSLTFRDNEFAAILGPSGSGKTTMLNIIGGLDHYDSGDLEIDGISTKKYKDSDWDTYRNNRIGFVFQSYNLISHQSVLANVELALTLGGVSKTERRQRAYQALEEVGLSEHARKLPNQLSGGQMQRVALARALINDPEILLADEPTGALDTKTSEQVMDLLKEIAKDRLVIMVTHNPELADEYANRIIQLQDGQIVTDTNPLSPEEENQREGRAPHKVSMSFLTAISLSLSNLLTKKGRTFVTALAGSIGIVGIAAILALSNGINAYINNIEQETMSIYPLTVQSNGLDLTAMLSNFMPEDSGDKKVDEEEQSKQEEQGILKERKIVETLFESQNENDLKSLKKYIVENEEKINPYVKNIQYTYDLTPQIYLEDTTNGIEQVKPDALLKNYGIGGNMGVMSMLGGGGGMNMYHEMPGNISMFDYQYEVVMGDWPKHYDEAVVVLLPDGSVSDFLLYSMGVRDREALQKMLEAFIENPEEKVELEDEEIVVTYDKLLNANLKVVMAADRFEYDEEFKVWKDKSGDKNFMRDLIDRGLQLKIVGIVKPDADATATSLSPGVNYTSDLIKHLMDEAATKPIVKAQLDDPKVNVITGKTFAEEKEENSNSGFNFEDLISVDEEAMQKAFKFDESKLDLDFSGMDSNLSPDMSGLGDAFDMDMSDLNDAFNMDMSGLENMTMPEFDMDDLTQAIAAEVQIPEEALTQILQGVVTGFVMEVASQGPMLPQDFIDAFSAYIARPDVQASINQQVSATMQDAGVSETIEQTVQGYMTGILQEFVNQLTAQMMQMQEQVKVQMQTQLQAMMGTMQAQLQSQLQAMMAEMQVKLQNELQGAMSDLPAQIQSEMETAMADLPDKMKDALSVDQDAIAAAFKVKMSEKEIMELMNALMNQSESTAENNLTLLGYANHSVPSQISFYPIDFEGKERVEDFLEQYNDKMKANGDDDKVITYTDLVGVMMSSVTDIVDTISYALIAFVAISLIVSSIMIGVITYISVLERKKEIGILRAVGASKSDVRRVFNAETLIIGCAAGVLGIAITQGASVIANIIVYDELGIENIAQLPWSNALVLIGISMLLAFVSGFFPAAAAARKDPVEALRSD